MRSPIAIPPKSELLSEFNPSANEPVHLYQIWLFPERKGLEPGYEQRAFPANEKHNRWRLVASRDGRDDSLTIHQDAELYLAALGAGQSLDYALLRARHAWIQILRGGATLNSDELTAGDGAAVSEESSLRVTATRDAELLLFDLA